MSGRPGPGPGALAGARRSRAEQMIDSFTINGAKANFVEY